MKDKIVRIEKSKTTKGTDMFKCQTENGNVVNFFDNQYMMFIDIHAYLKDMQEGDVLRFKSCPITVEMYKRGNFWNIEHVSKSTLIPLPDKAAYDVTPHRNFAANWATVAAVNPCFVYLDVETTGLTEDAEIISIAIVAAQTSKTLLNSFIRPSTLSKITPEITELTGITKLQADTAPRFKALYPQIAAAIAGKCVVAYNSEFDRKALERACINTGMPIPPTLTWIDALPYVAQMYADYDPDREQFTHLKLTEAVQKAGLPIDNAHNALGDCLMLRSLLVKIACTPDESEDRSTAMKDLVIDYEQV